MGHTEILKALPVWVEVKQKYHVIAGLYLIYLFP